MKHRVEIDLSFDDKQDAIDLLNYIEGIKTKPYKVIGDEVAELHTKCRYHQCYHDENPNSQCGNYTSVDFNKPKQAHNIGVL